MIDRSRRMVQILVLVALGLVVGCGTGGDDDGGCPPGTIGYFIATVNITVPCASNASVTWTADIESIGPDRIRILLYVPETGACCPETAVMFATRTSAVTYDVDDVDDVTVCALNDQYGYQSLSVANATMTLAGSNFLIEGDIGVIAGPACTGDLTILGVPNP